VATPLIGDGLNDGFLAVACTLNTRSWRPSWVARFRTLDQIERLGRQRDHSSHARGLPNFDLEAKYTRRAYDRLWDIESDVSVAAASEYPS
jgi:hypothetical protein